MDSFAKSPADQPSLLGPIVAFPPGTVDLSSQASFDALKALSAESAPDTLIQFFLPGSQFPLYMRAQSSDIWNFFQIFIQDEYNLVAMDNPEVILDLGAYVGYAAVYFASRYPNCKIICVEPSNRNFEALRLNTRPYPNIELIHAAIWSKNTHLQLIETQGQEWGTRVQECAPDDNGAFQAITIQNIIEQHHIQRIDLLKVDIEGSEKQVFSHNTEGWFPLVRQVSCELHDHFVAGCREAYAGLFGSAGEFDCITSGEYTIYKRKSLPMAQDSHPSGAPEKISVVVPTYNRESYVRNSIRFFLAQTYPNKELLILDDSEQPSPALEALCHSYDNIRYMYQAERQTLGEKLNTLVSQASGEIIAQFDDDDYYAPTYLETMLAQLKATDSDFVKLSGWFACHPEKQIFAYWDTAQLLPYHYLLNKDGAVYIATQSFHEHFLEQNLWGYGFCYVFKKEVYEQVGCRAMTHGVDYDFYVRMVEKGYRAHCFPDTQGLALHVMHATNSSLIYPQYVLPTRLMPEMFHGVDMSLLLPDAQENRFPVLRDPSGAPAICLNMIVKNEGKIIENALSSLVGVIDYYVICDTGSSDGTPELIQRFFADKGIPGEIHHTQFIDFAQARNEALTLAQRSKADFDYILLTDADMECRVTDPDFKRTLDADYYLVTQENDTLSYQNVRLVKKNIVSYYVGVTHEYIHCEGNRVQLEGMYFYDHCNGGNRPEKYERDIRLLEQGLAQEPESTRYHFYMAQTYYDIGNYDKAKEYYRKRIELGGWEEEVYYSYFRIGVCEKFQNQSEGAMLKAFMDCYNYRPTRAEPLYELAHYYRCNSKCTLGYLFAKAAAAIPYPKDDLLFVFKNVYTFNILDELSICAYWVGEYQECYDICQTLLAGNALPESERERVLKNLGFAQAKLQERQVPVG